LIFIHIVRNGFLAQSEETRAEAKFLMSVGNNFTSSQDSKPMLAIKQDAMTGAYKLTYGNVRIRKEIFMDCFTHEKFGVDKFAKKYAHIKRVYQDIGLLSEESTKEFEELVMFCGHTMFSFLLPDDFEYHINNNISPIHTYANKPLPDSYKKIYRRMGLLHDDVDGHQVHEKFSFLLPGNVKNDTGDIGNPLPIHITQGVLISGTLNKDAMGNASASLIHHLWKDYGQTEACWFVSMFQICINFWFCHEGFSIGLEDCIPSNQDVIDKEVQKSFLKAHAILTTESDKELSEMRIIEELNKAVTIGQRHAKAALQPTNNLVSMIRSGSKGDWMNITQVTGLLGQQNVSAARIAKTYGNRSLPHFLKQGRLVQDPDQISENASVDEVTRLFLSRGFCTSSFYYGLTPIEYFFHAAGGREGLIDTGCKTADTGYQP
jgi:DNA-directed RNA polymerase II subunit RPB1